MEKMSYQQDMSINMGKLGTRISAISKDEYPTIIVYLMRIDSLQKQSKTPAVLKQLRQLNKSMDKLIETVLLQEKVFEC